MCEVFLLIWPYAFDLVLLEHQMMTTFRVTESQQVFSYSYLLLLSPLCIALLHGSQGLRKNTGPHSTDPTPYFPQIDILLHSKPTLSVAIKLCLNLM